MKHLAVTLLLLTTTIVYGQENGGTTIDRSIRKEFKQVVAPSPQSPKTTVTPQVTPVEATTTPEVNTNLPQRYIQNAAGETIKVDRNYYRDLISALDYNIQAIDQKVEWVKSDAEENKLALENGFYTEMEESRARLLEEKKAFELLLQSLPN